MTSILARLQPIFQDIFDDETIIVERTTNSDTVEDWDSLAHINLVTAIEKEFSIRFVLSELDKMKDVGDMIDLMEAKLL